MNKQTLMKKVLYCHIFFTSIILIFTFEINAQSPLYMDIGSFHAVFTPDFYESYEHAGDIYTNKYGGANWICWPSEYTRENGSDAQGLLGASGIYITLSEFTDKNGGRRYPFTSRCRLNVPTFHSLRIRPFPYVRRTIRFHPCQHVFRIVRYKQHIQMFPLDKSLGNRMIQKR